MFMPLLSLKTSGLTNDYVLVFPGISFGYLLGHSIIHLPITPYSWTWNKYNVFLFIRRSTCTQLKMGWSSSLAVVKKGQQTKGRICIICISLQMDQPDQPFVCI